VELGGWLTSSAEYNSGKEHSFSIRGVAHVCLGLANVGSCSKNKFFLVVLKAIDGGWPALAFFARVGCDAADSLVVIRAIALFRVRARPQDPPVALRSDLAHDNHQNSNFLFRLR